MVAVTRDFADDLAEVARLLSENEVAAAAGFGSVRGRMAAAAFRQAGER